jgi:hypothetical protein
LTLAADATVPLGAATKRTVDAALNDVGRNLLHNGLFNIQQRGVGPLSGSGYLADRWYVLLTNDTVSTSIVALTDADRAAIGDEAAATAVQIVFAGSATVGSYSVFGQRQESIRRLAGKTVTLSFYGRATSGTPVLDWAWTQWFGAGGSPSAAVGGAIGSTPALNTTWQRYSFMVTLPSVSGKTFGTTAGTDWLEIKASLSVQGSRVQSGTVQFWGMQLEVGSIATPLEKPDPQVDLAKCQRFYQIVQMFVVGLYSPAASNAMGCGMTLSIPMRGSATVTVAGNFSSGPLGAFAWAYQSNGLLYGSAPSTGVGYVQVNVALTVSADL